MDTDTASTPAESGEGWVFRALTTAGKRLFWTLNGPLEDAIRVAPSEYHGPDVLDSMEPYFGPDGSPHAVSQASLLEPPVSSVTNPGRLAPRPDNETFNPNLFVAECCGEKRPWAYDTQLQVAAAAQGGFLTVHEYVSAVHPWLMAMRDTLLDVLGKVDGKPKWPPETTKLAVLNFGTGPLCIGHQDGWAWWHRRPIRPSSVVHPSIAHLSAEERAQRTIERMLARAAAQTRAAREEAERAAAAAAAAAVEMEKEK